MRRVSGTGLAGILVVALALAGSTGAREAAAAQKGQQALAYPPHRYIFVPLMPVLVDIDDPYSSTLPVNYWYNITTVLTGLDLGVTYLEGPEIPADWLSDPSLFAAVLSGMKRIDIGCHTQGVNTIVSNDVFNINGQQVPSIAYPPTNSDPDFDLEQFRLLGYFYLAWVYAGVNTGNIINDIATVTNMRDLPPQHEVIFRKNFRPYKLIRYDPLTDPDGSIGEAFGREVILEIINNASDTEDFVVETRNQTRLTAGAPLYPSGKPQVSFWNQIIGRYHKCSLQLEGTSQQARRLEPRLSRFPLRDPSTPICPNDPYVWYLPHILGFLQGFLTADEGERCGDVDTWVELDAGQWWNAFGTQFVEILTGPFAAQDAAARAWVFLHVAMNNGHRLIDTVNPVDGEGNQIPQIIDVAAFDPELFPATFEGAPRIHGYHKRLISPSVSELYKRFYYIMSVVGPTQLQRMAFFRTNMGSIISNVHIYVGSPTNPFQKAEINVPTFFQMIADRWDARKAYGLIPFAFLFTDIPEIDRGQGPPLVFEITCDFDTDPTLGGPYVPMRIIADAHEGYYLTTDYGDAFYALIHAILGGGLPFY